MLWSSGESPRRLAAGAGRADDVKPAKITYPRAGASKVTRDKSDERMWQVVNEIAA